MTLYVVPTPAFFRIGFIPVYSPTPKRPLHVIIIPHQRDDTGDIPQEDRTKLAQLIQEFQVPK